MNKIALCDAVVFVGHCKYQPRSWHSRTQIRDSHHGMLRLSVPVHKGISINETKPLPQDYWREHHLHAIELQYANARYFNDYFPEIAICLKMPVNSLSELNIGLIRVLMRMLDITTTTYESTDLDFVDYQPDDRQPRKTRMLAEMCARLGARHYLSSPGEINYIDKTQMNGFGHSFQEFEHPIYEQGGRSQQHWNKLKFVPNLSVIDLLFNVGPEAATIVREAGHI